MRTGAEKHEQAATPVPDRLDGPHPLYEHLVCQVTDYAIIGLDGEGVIETWNLGAERLKGYRAGEAIGRHFSMFYTEEDREADLPMTLLRRAAGHGRVEHTGWRLRKDGSRFWGDVIITAIHDDDGELSGFTKITRDRTDVKALDDARSTFFAAFNHDFRTPVAALKGFVDALRDAEEDERELLIDRVEANADKLVAMVEDLIQFATQRAARDAVHVDHLDVARVARDAVKDLPPSLGPERVHVDEAAVFALANDVAMHRVFTNLLINALKYSHPPTPVVVTFEEAADGRVRVSVTDEGRGVDPEDLELIWGEFQRGRLARADGGTGLGLASVRDLVEQQGGAVSLTSQVNAGTTVTVDLRSSTTRSP